ncbi:H-NS family nucleoid-associated regulatory protein [Diaphorobacter sp. J5-51]|uniref:H-NS histone family protein n=1 Tax=Diaphorobacter sp. J5-51 TaxID=680496 RepID=UPI0006435BAD|nr:H-NS histone family protein [Diaphorobacter sp. J5-51]KLR58975.1 histone [Diaphorobacter sp. J5-51]
MTASYKELLAQREQLEAQIKQARAAELTAAVAKVRTIIAEYELTQNDVFPSGRGSIRVMSVSKVAPKYRNPATGATWTGRGKPPVWIAGKDRADFEIKEAVAA